MLSLLCIFIASSLSASYSSYHNELTSYAPPMYLTPTPAERHFEHSQQTDEYRPFSGEKTPSTTHQKDTEVLGELRKLQIEGKKDELRQEIDAFKAERFQCFKPHLRILIREAEALYNDSMTDIFYHLVHGSHEEATASLDKLERMSPFKYHTGKDIAIDEHYYELKARRLTTKYGCDLLNKARQLYNQRLDVCPRVNGIFVNKEGAATFIPDQKATTPSHPVEISPEVDALIQQRLSQLTIEEQQCIDQLSDAVGAILFEMHQLGALTPENVQILDSAVAKIAIDDVPVFCKHVTTAFAKRLCDPISIVSDQARGIYGLSKFLCDITLGRYYMAEQQQWEFCEQSLKTLIDTIDSLKSLNSQQAADLIGIASADMLFNWGSIRTIGYLQKAGAASRCAKEMDRVITTLQKQFVYETEQIATAEGSLLSNSKGARPHGLTNETSKIASSLATKTVRRQGITMADILEQATRIKNKGAKIYEISGSAGYQQALNDFKSLMPTNVKNISNPKFEGMTGQIEGNIQATVRSWSKLDGRPTLEFNISGLQSLTKVRYGK